MVNSKQLQGIPVRTVGGQNVGKLLSLDLDTETGRMTALRVKISGFVPALLDQEALVAWSQVVSLGPEEIVVKETTVVERATWLSKKLASNT